MSTVFTFLAPTIAGRSVIFVLCPCLLCTKSHFCSIHESKLFFFTHRQDACSFVDPRAKLVVRRLEDNKFLRNYFTNYFLGELLGTYSGGAATQLLNPPFFGRAGLLEGAFPLDQAFFRAFGSNLKKNSCFLKRIFT